MDNAVPVGQVRMSPTGERLAWRCFGSSSPMWVMVVLGGYGTASLGWSSDDALFADWSVLEPVGHPSVAPMPRGRSRGMPLSDTALARLRIVLRRLALGGRDV